MIIVGIGHKSRQGKDEFANFLTTYLRVHTRNKRISKSGFADVLKHTCHNIYGWAGAQDPEHYERYSDDRKRELQYFDPPKNIVDLWIEFGNHCRQFDENIWINALLRGTKADVLIIKDVRFPNETKAIKEHGGLLVKVTRPGYDGLPSVSDNALNDFEGWDTYVQNDRDLKHLYNLAEIFAQPIIKKLDDSVPFVR